jgi:hypothetical protein
MLFDLSMGLRVWRASKCAALFRLTQGGGLEAMGGIGALRRIEAVLLRPPCFLFMKRGFAPWTPIKGCIP